jgi:hypothetical protein
LGDSFNFVRFHLQLLTRSVVKLVSEEAMSTTHVANGCDEYVQEDRRKRLTDRQLCVTSKKLFGSKIHLALNFVLARKKPRDSY